MKLQRLTILLAGILSLLVQTVRAEGPDKSSLPVYGVEGKCVLQTDFASGNLDDAWNWLDPVNDHVGSGNKLSPVSVGGVDGTGLWEFLEDRHAIEQFVTCVLGNLRIVLRDPGGDFNQALDRSRRKDYFVVNFGVSLRASSSETPWPASSCRAPSSARPRSLGSSAR